MWSFCVLLITAVTFSMKDQWRSARGKTIETAITLGMDYLKNNVKTNGRFNFLKSADPNGKFNKREYNVIRHACPLYSMYLCERHFGDTSLRAERLLATKYFIDNYVVKIPKISKTVYAVLSGGVAELGGAGLGLVVLSNLYPEGKIKLDVLRGIAEFVFFLLQPNGDLYHKYDIRHKEINKEFICTLYPGEACLGLLYLYEVDPQKKYLDASKKILLRLAEKRAANGTNVEFDHWAMLSTGKLFSTHENELTEVEKTALLKHCDQMAKSVVNKQRTDREDPYYGAFKKYTTPVKIATIMEGLDAIYGVTRDEKLKSQVLSCLERGTEFLSNVQIKTGAVKGGIPLYANWKDSKAKPDAANIRIDIVHHALNAWILYCNLNIGSVKKSIDL